MQSVQENRVEGRQEKHASTLRVVDESDSEIGEADVDGHKDRKVPKELPFRVGSEIEEFQHSLVANVYWILFAVLACTCGDADTE